MSDQPEVEPENEQTEVDQEALIAYIANTLGETDPTPLRQIRLIVENYGADFAYNLLDEVMKIEAKGGMLVMNKKQRRTPGGIYFFLARQRAKRFKVRKIFFTDRYGKPWPIDERDYTEPRFDYAERLAIFADLWQEKGTANTLNVTLIGRPGKVEYRREVVILTMAYRPKQNISLPKGVPRPPDHESPCAVYVAAKQWRKVVDTLQNNEQEAVVIEGVASLDTEACAIAVYAQKVSVRLMKAPKKPGEADSAEDGQPREASPAAQVRQSPPQAAPTKAPIPNRPAGPNKPFDGPPPPEVVQHLAELRRAESEARERFNEIKELPPNDQIGIGAALQELHKVQGEIKKLKIQYPRLN